MTTAQKEVLRRAIDAENWSTDKPKGRLMDYGVSSTTISVMVREGWIERDFAVRDEAKRASIEANIENRLQGARIALAANDWKMAHGELSRAKDGDADLKAVAWWITDKGRAALEDAQ